MSERTTSRAVPLGTIAREWWEAYCSPEKGDAATRARLRRSRTVLETFSVPAARILAKRMGALKETAMASDAWIESTLGLARVLAYVRQNTDTSPMRAAGWESFPGDQRDTDAGGNVSKPKLSEVRFQRFLQAERGDELVIAFVRLLGLIDGAVNVERLTTDFLRWGEDTKRRMAFEYYNAANAAPLSLTSLTSSTTSEISA